MHKIMEKWLTKSENYTSEYCCTLVKIGEVKDIEGSDFLGVTLVEGREIVVRKDQVKEGDEMFYVANECQLNQDFLSINNLFEDKTLNTNPEIKGYFNKYGRVRMVKLRGKLSMGFLFGFDELQKWCPKVQLDIQVGEDFDTVGGELFVKAYMPPVKEHHTGTGEPKRNKKLVKFDRMIPGQFSFHYDTQQLQRNMYRLIPDQSVTISVKLHGTSFICGNILVKKPKWGGLYSKLFNKLPSWLQFTNSDYDIIYSSRTVIKNQYINDKVSSGYYNTDIWGEYAKILRKYIPRDIIIYGEIVGYLSEGNQMIQKGYDYGCMPGQNQLMIYRIVKNTPEGKKEYNVMDVRNYTIGLIEIMKANEDQNYKKLRPIDVLYVGKLSDLYPQLNVENHWQENLLEELKNDSEHFGMEQDEPLCRNKVPREGIVLRIDDDIINEAFKLKTLKFLGKEAKEMDKGEVNDIEMEEKYGA